MATRENAGAVVVMIDGDASPLLAKYAQVETQSRAAGTRIATALGGGFQSSTGLVDQFGRSIRTNAVAPLEQAAPVAQRTAVAIRAVGTAARGSVTEIQASSAALRTLEGGTQGSIRAAERFISIIPGVGAALQVAFPLIGLVAFAEIITRIIGKFTGLSDAEKEAEQSNKEFSDSISELKRRLDELNLEEFTAIYGKIAGAFRKSSQAVTGDVSSDMQKIALLKAQIADVQAHGAEAQSPAQAVKRAAIQELVPFGADINRSSGEAAQKQKLIELTQQLDVAETKLSVDQKQGAVDAISAMKDLSDQDEKTAAEQARAAQEAARAAQQAAREQAQAQKQRMEEISRASKSFYSELNRQAREAVAEQKRAGEEMSRGLLEGMRQGLPEVEAVMTDFFRDLDEQRKESQRQTQEGIRTGGERTQVSDEASKARLQVEYASQLVHSRAQELTYAESIARADQQAILDKIASLEALKQYQESQSLADEANKTDLEIEKEKVALLKQRASDEEKIAKLKQEQTLAGQIQQKVGSAGNLNDAFNGLASDTVKNSIDGISAAFGRAVQGGENLSKIFRNLGKQLLGEVVAGIAKIGLQMITTAAIGKSVGSTLAVAEVISAAAVGAANAAAATAAIPIIGPALAPGVAAATFAEIAAYAGLASYDKGGFIAQDQIAMVHKGEYVLTADQVSSMGAPVSGTSGIGTSQLTSSMVHNSDSRSLSIGAIHLHGVRDMQDVARRLPDVLKARSPVFSPASR